MVKYENKRMLRYVDFCAALFFSIFCLLPAVSNATPGFPAIDVWYGGTQSFGVIGQPQTWVNILGNVRDDATITAFDASSVNGGSVADNGDGTFTYTPPTGFTGADTFTYTLTDDLSASDTATVTIQVGPTTAGVPVALNDNYSTVEARFITTGNVLANDTLVDNAAISAFDAATVNGGSVVSNNDGTFIYYPPASPFTGNDSFTYTLTDDDLETDTATVTVTVRAAATVLPVAMNDTVGTDTNVPVTTGNVRVNDLLGDKTAISSLSYSLNGGPGISLSLGPAPLSRPRRLIDPGDFNADIATSSLQEGANTVVVTAQDNAGQQTVETVTLNYSGTPIWPLPYTIDWSSVTDISDVAQVVDGFWTLEGDTIRSVQLGYDRLVAIGDITWDNYEVTVPVTVHGVDPVCINNVSDCRGSPGISALMRWQGHYDWSAAQPEIGYFPIGGVGAYEWDRNNLSVACSTSSCPGRLSIAGGEFNTLVEDTSRDLPFGVPHIFKMRAETVAGQGHLYRFKMWPEGQPEPAQWDLSGLEPLTSASLANGSMLLVAHNVDASFGDVVVTALVPDTTPPVISNVQVSVTDTTATVSWDTDEAADSVVDYGLDATYGTTVSDAGLVTSHSVTINGLTAETLYHYQVSSTDGSGNIGSGVDLTFMTNAAPDDTPPVISNVQVAVTDTTATITWDTDEPANSVVDYGLDVTYGTTVSDAGLVTSHSVTLTGLGAGTLYHYQVSSTDGSGNIGSGADLTFMTNAVPDTTPPVISNVQVVVTDTTATVSWDTDEAADSEVDYGLDAMYGTTVSDAALVTSHSVTINGLTAETLYHYRVSSTDGSGNSASEPDATLTTGAATTGLVADWPMNEGSGITTADTTGNGHDGTLVNGPLWAVDRGLEFDGVNDYVDVGALDVTGSEITLTAWIRADNLANCSSRDCRIISKANGLSSAEHYVMLSTIKSGTATRLRFRLKTGGTTATLIAGSGDLVNNQWVHVAAVYDGSTMTLYKDGVSVGSIPNSGSITTNASIPLWIGGNPSGATDRPWDGQIDDVSIYNRALSAGEIAAMVGGDSTPPVISNVQVAVTDTTATITWDTDEPANSVVDYGLDVTYGTTVSDAGLVTSHSVTLTGLGAGTLYHYQVSSTDGSGNIGSGADLTFMTNAVPDTTPPVISNVQVVVTDTTATVSWDTDEAADSEVDYGLDAMYGTTVSDAALVTSHSVTINGLTAETLYHYRVSSTDGSGNSASEPDATLTTGAATTGLVADWPMNEGSGITTADTTGNGHDGTLVNGPLWAVDRGLEFDGVNDYVDVGALDVTGSEITLTAWIRADNLANCSSRDCRIISKANGLSSAEHYVMLSTIKSGTATRLRFRLKTGGTTATLIAGSGDLVNNQWVHVAAVYDGSTMTLYKDGVSVGSIPNSGSITTNASIPLWIGGNPSGATDRPWDGQIDDVSIYNRALSAGEIAAMVGGDSTPPVISNVQVAVTDTTATITWDTDEPANSVVDYGLDVTYGTTVSDAGLVTSHSVTINGLTAETLYHYQAASTDGSGNLTSEPDASFTTAAQNGNPLTILQQPSNQTVFENDIATFSVTVTGTGTIDYQWRVNGIAIPGATNSSFTMVATLSNDGDSIDCIVSDDVTSTTSAPATLNVLPQIDPGANLALNKPATASSVENTTYTADKAFDGAITTRWGSKKRKDPQWIYVDLESVFSIDRVVLNWESAYSVAYQIEVSQDGATWTSVYSTTNAGGGIEDIPFTPTDARFVRLYSTQRVNSRWGVSLWEFEVYSSGL